MSNIFLKKQNIVFIYSLTGTHMQRVCLYLYEETGNLYHGSFDHGDCYYDV